jgi:hypothetical protein
LKIGLGKSEGFKVSMPIKQTFRFYVTICIVLVLVGCAGSDPKRADAPAWLNKVPDNDRYFYAVGVSGMTRNTNDAWNQAANRGRAELGRTIVAHVSSKDLIIATSRSEYTRQVIDILSDTELNFTEVIERWYDRYGSFGPPNHFYVLVRLEKKQAATILKNLQP